MSKSDKKVALVTGANKGIGLETVRQLAGQGITVLLGARDEKKGAEAAGKLKAEGLDVQFVYFDVNDRASYDSVAKFIADKFGRLDILVNNAAISNDGAYNASNLPINLLRQTFDTNFFGLIESTQKLLPLISKSEAGRIVNLSSILGSLTIHSDPKGGFDDFKPFGYDSSKTALNAFTVHLAHALRDTKIKVNSAHPGWVKTDMGGEAAPLEVEEGAKTSVQLATLPDDGPTGGHFHLGQPVPW